MKRYSGFKLLIVDDNENNLFALRTLIQKHMDVEVLEANSGQMALDIALSTPDLDLIVHVFNHFLFHFLVFFSFVILLFFFSTITNLYYYQYIPAYYHCLYYHNRIR